MQCNCCRKIYPADGNKSICSDSNINANLGYNVKYNKDTFEAEDPLPSCKNCTKVLIRPNILMFSDFSFLPDRVDE